MHVISIQGSKAQKSKLRNGHKVRIKHGKGFNVIVSPNTYHVVSRAFLRNKGVSLQLTPDELAMNKAPSPEMQQTIMGHKEHMVIPGVVDHINLGGRGLGTGIGDFFSNIGNQIKSGFEQKIINPINEKIVQPVTELYNKNVPEDVRRDIGTVNKIANPVSLLANVASRVTKGDSMSNIFNDYKNDLQHLNDSKNKLIKSNPVTKAMYKKAVPALFGLAAGTVGTAATENPVAGALFGAAGSKAGEELVKAEGYGIHHLIHRGMEHYEKHKRHLKPVLGMLGKGHITDFFKNAGKRVKNIVHSSSQKANDYVINNPILGKMIKEHGPKLAGLLAKQGAKYLLEDDELAKIAGDVAQEGAKAGFQHLKYGEPVPKPESPREVHSTIQHKFPTKYGKGIHKRKRHEGYGLYAGAQRGVGLYGGGSLVHHFGTISPPSRLVGGGFNSFSSIHEATMDNAHANSRLARMSDRTVHGQHETSPIKSYYNDTGEPPSRGYGLHSHHSHHHGKVHHSRKLARNDHYNLIRGRGSIIGHRSELPPALQSQPYGANFHMQNMLPPQYHKYNDGTNEY